MSGPGTAQTPPLPDDPLVRFLVDPLGTVWDALAGWVDSLPGHADAGDGVRWIVVGLLGLALVAAGGWAVGRGWRQRRRHAHARLIQVLCPPTVDPAGAAALWRNLSGLLHQRRLLDGRPHVSFEYAWSPDGLTIRLWVPSMVGPRLVERAIQAAWPGARTTTTAVTGPPMLTGGRVRGRVLGGRLRLARPDHFPLATDHRADPLRALLGAAEELGGGEHSIVQVLARPARGRRLAQARRTAARLRTGQPATAGPGLGDFLLPRSDSGRAAGRGTKGTSRGADPGRNADVAAILAKTADLPAWQVTIRYGVATTTDQRPRQRLRARAHALVAAFAAYTGRNWLTRARQPRPAAALAGRRLGRGDLYGLAELAAVAHLPTDAAVPGLRRAGARSVPPPPGVPAAGKLLGDADAGPARQVAITAADARHHLAVTGATGVGKSTLLANLALADITAGRGVVVVDPKGDLITDLLARMPERAARRTVLLDPDEASAPPTLNMLEGDNHDLAVDHVVGVFRRIFAVHWGQRTDDILRSACLTLLRSPSGATLADVPRLLTDPAWRERIVARVGDPGGLGAFWSWYETLTPAGQAQAIGPVLSKLRAFLLRTFVRDVVGSTTSSFAMPKVLDGGVFLVRVPKGILGDDAARLLGSFVIAKAWQAALARANQPAGRRADATLIVDECHNFLTLPYRYEEMLPEARSYGLSLVLAHQHQAQLPRELREAISANARSKVIFTVSPEDAGALHQHVAPQLTPHDLAHLAGYQAAVRLMVGGIEQPAFTLRTRPLPRPIAGRADVVRHAARQRYGRTITQRRQEAEQRREAAQPTGRRTLRRRRHGTDSPSP